MGVLFSSFHVSHLLEQMGIKLALTCPQVIYYILS
jgi:hypothetical protein